MEMVCYNKINLRPVALWRSQEFDWGGVYVLNSHCNFKTCANVPYVNKRVTDFFLGCIYTDIPPVARPLFTALFSLTAADLNNQTFVSIRCNMVSRRSTCILLSA